MSGEVIDVLFPVVVQLFVACEACNQIYSQCIAHHHPKII